MKILIVGAGFAGATHARELAERGHEIRVIDKRNHIGGNAFDEVMDGVRVHRYGPHLFHTNNETVVEWLKRFGEWVEYRHSVKAQLPSGSLTPLPVNLTTLEEVFDTPVPDEKAAKELLAKLAVPIANPANAEEHLLSTIGRELTELFFARYTFKMWGVPLSQMDKAVVQRIPLRFDRQNFYFPNDAFQMMPRHGYTAIFENILDHANIHVDLSVSFDRSLAAGFNHVFNAMPIDEFFGFQFGPLPYRSIKFHHRNDVDGHAEIPVINYTDSGKHTRRTSWEALPHHKVTQDGRLFTLEEPCDYTDNDLERYYPVKTASGENEERLQKYKELAAVDDRMTFIGRCGTYQYLDMHQVINQSLMSADRWHRTRV